MLISKNKQMPLRTAVSASKLRPYMGKAIPSFGGVENAPKAIVISEFVMLIMLRRE